MGKELEVRLVQQEGKNGCWAAAVNMLSLYYRSKVIFCDSPDAMSVDLQGDINTVAKLNDFHWESAETDFASVSGVIEGGDILLMIGDKNGTGHAMILCGYNEMNGTVKVIDPMISYPVWIAYSTNTKMNIKGYYFTLDSLWKFVDDL